MGYLAYSDYDVTDTGVSHPKNWLPERLRFSIISNPVKSEVNDWDKDQLVSFVPMDSVGEYGGIDTSQEKPLGEVYGGYTYFIDGDVLIAKITPCFENGKGAIARCLTNGVGFGTTEFHVIRPLENISERWLFYLSMSDAFRKIGASEMLGAGGQKRVPEDFIKNFRIGIPSQVEQKQIADFLDWKTGQIDTLIAKKKQLIEKLQEQRVAVITQAVTKGLNPDAPMKDSGVPWLGEVPEQWEVKRMKFYTERIFTGSTPPSAEVQYYEDPTLDWYTPGDFSKTRSVLADARRKLNIAAVNDGMVRMFEVTCVLIVGIGATLGRVGFANPAFACNQQINVAVPNSEIDPKFLFYSLSVKEEAMKVISNASTLGIMNQEATRQIQISAPGIKEQGKIVELLDREVIKLDELFNKLEAAITRLTEYRTALITAATTGKIDVRDIQIPSAE